MRPTRWSGKKSPPSRGTADSARISEKIHSLIESGELLKRIEKVVGGIT
jgi:hypothetical protein